MKQRILKTETPKKKIERTSTQKKGGTRTNELKTKREVKKLQN